MTSELTHLWACDETIFRTGIPTQRKWTNQKELIVNKLLQFSRQEWIQKIKSFKCYTEKDKNKNWTDLYLLGQEPTFKVSGRRRGVLCKTLGQYLSTVHKFEESIHEKRRYIHT